MFHENKYLKIAFKFKNALINIFEENIFCKIFNIKRCSPRAPKCLKELSLKINLIDITIAIIRSKNQPYYSLVLGKKFDN